MPGFDCADSRLQTALALAQSDGRGVMKGIQSLNLGTLAAHCQ